jgi:hypothetical protein
VLCGYEAAEALDKYIRKLEKRRVKNLSERQVNALIKAAKVIRTAVVE